jgi:hypothetical protein
MRRTAIAAAWLVAATVPLLMATVMIFGCCVLPFHRVIHKIVPLCNVAMNLMRGEHHAADPQKPLPARAKQEPVKRIASEVPRTFRLVVAADAQHVVRANAVASYRSFIALGALRCDQDVGLHLLVSALLI